MGALKENMRVERKQNTQTVSKAKEDWVIWKDCIAGMELTIKRWGNYLGEKGIPSHKLMLWEMLRNNGKNFTD